MGLPENIVDIPKPACFPVLDYERIAAGIASRGVRSLDVSAYFVFSMTGIREDARDCRSLLVFCFGGVFLCIAVYILHHIENTTWHGMAYHRGIYFLF